MKVTTKENSPAVIESKLKRFRLLPADKRALLSALAEPVGYIPHPLFRRPSAIRQIIDHHVAIAPGTSLTTPQERTLFLQMNYARYRASRVRAKLSPRKPWSRSSLLELLRWHRAGIDTRSRIVTANMGLVLAMAKRKALPGVEFPDLLSDGSMALLRATDKFDCDRGFRFSTYACRAIFRSFSAAARRHYRHCRRFAAQWPIALEEDHHLEYLREEHRNGQVEELRGIIHDNLADLSGIELSVIQLRFALTDDQPDSLTLQQVGERLGLTKERIRQIQKKALAKLRSVARDRVVAT